MRPLRIMYLNKADSQKLEKACKKRPELINYNFKRVHIESTECIGVTDVIASLSLALTLLRNKHTCSVTPLIDDDYYMIVSHIF